MPIPPGQFRCAPRWSAACGGLGAGWVPAEVWACPSCVARAPGNTGTSALLMGAMLLTPFLLVAVGAWVAWRTARGDAARKP
ncbi:hypothetical protein [Stigmatella erecta]|uniref:Uncharacterized protein n=1 Tax=Stigmatella erecta TaxID=83460 RepID=A0A1I0KEP6_9BACT|nr:hypothetical protein [Stigmatella erecta]SEU22911.1 hypothetical protein SAMN05443639_110185 [Stigmatella erecta]